MHICSSLAVLLLYVLLVSLASALVVDKTIFLRQLTDFEQFGFAANGTIALRVSTDSPQANVSVFICQDKQFDQLTSTSDPSSIDFCSNTEFKTCEYYVDHNEGVQQHYRVQTKNRYHLLLVQCGSKNLIKASVQYTLLNPRGEQLPLGEIPLPFLYIVITCIWAILVGMCGFVWLKNRQHVVMLHALLCAVGVLKLAVVVVALCYWHTFQATGKDIVQLKYLQSFIYALSETAFFCALLLISKGWRITRSNLPPSEIRTISVALVLLLSTLLFFSFYNDGYYFLSLMIMYFFMLPKIFTSITRNTRALHTHMLLARYANVELNSEPVLAKIQMFKALRTAVILYLGSILIISSMKIIMWWFLVWVTFFVSELVTIVMIVAVCVLTRPRENGVFSPRSYFEGGPFPILNMQQFDQFDELFGDQIWDPDLVFGTNAAAIAAASGHPQIDVSESIVIEYPMPSFSQEEGEVSYFPRLAIATPERQKDKEKEKEKDSEEVSGGEKGGSILRRRGTSSHFTTSNQLASSTSALLSPESPSLMMSSGSSSPLLNSSSSNNTIPFDGLELDIVVHGGEERGVEGRRARSHSLATTATQTSSSTSPSPSSSRTTTTTTTTTTTSQSYDQPPPSPSITSKHSTRETKRRTYSNAEQERKRDGSDGVTTSTTSSSTSSTPPSPPPCTTTETSPSRSLSHLNSPAFTSSSSLLSKDEEDDEGLL